MAVSFGSVGDIIAVCLLVKDLVAALDDSRGSAAEYQEVRRELQSLERALLEVEYLSSSCTSTVKLNALYATARKAALDCQKPVAAFLKKIKSYGPSLGESSSRSIVRDTAMKFRWRISQKDEVTKFRAEINAHCSSINMLLATANVSLSQANHADISNKLRDAHDEDRDNITAQGRLLRRIQDQVKENNVLLVANNNITSNIKEALRLDWFKQLGSELRAFMQRIITINISTYNALIAIQQTISSRPELSLLQEPFILEDAIGRISPVHMQFINSWEAFHAVLSRRFQDVQGYKKVQSGEYILQEHVTRREISRSHRWEAAILPGQRIEMSFVFNSESRDSVSASCPSCNKVSDGSPDAEILCKGCGIWYRRITEIIDVEPPALSHKPVPHLHDSPAKFGQPSFNAILYGPKPPSRFPALSSSPKRKLDCLELEEDDVSQFKRVWFISKRRKLKNIAGPFLYSQNMDASVLDPTETQEVEEERAWQQLDELKSSLGTLHVDTLSRIEHLARILRNRKKYLPAEKLLRNTISAGEEFLIAEKPEILLAMLHSLMTVLVDQCKFGEADELWVQSIEMFQERLGSDFTKALREGFELAHPFQHSSGSEAPSLATISTSSKIIDMVSALSATVFLQPRDCGEVLIDEEDDLNITSTSKRPSVECAAFGSHGIGSLRNKSLQFAHDDDEDDFWNWTAVLGSDYRAFRAKGSVSTDFGSAFLYGSSEFSDMNSRENQRVESPILDENFRISEDSLDSSAHLQRPQMPVKMKRIYICICCRMLRIKCHMNPAGPGEECMACTARTARTVSRIDKVPCLRSNLLHLRLFVTDFWLEDHNWSHRWPSGGRRENITAWASSDTRTIQVTHDYSANILELEVREFVPIEKDMLCMQWEDRGIIKSVLLPMYAVADTFTATKIYKRYIGQESPQVFNSTVNENERLLRETYKIAITTSKAAKREIERNVLDDVMQLWTTARICSRTARICGQETLDTSPDITDSSSPLYKQIPLPPMINAQIRLVIAGAIQTPLQDRILNCMQRLWLDRSSWFCTYLCTFILLYNFSLLAITYIARTGDHGDKDRRKCLNFFKQQQHEANILLAHFHCARGGKVFVLEWTANEIASRLKLSSVQIEFIRQTKAWVKDNEVRFKKILEETDYRDEYYFVAQLYEANWKLRATT